MVSVGLVGIDRICIRHHDSPSFTDHILTPSRPSARAPLTLLTLMLLGCSPEGVVASRGELLGTYVLRTVSGNALPALGNGEFMTAFTMVAGTDPPVQQR